MRCRRVGLHAEFPYWASGLPHDGARTMVGETLRFLLVATIAVATLFITAAILTGCSELKYVECVARDNTRNPCQ